MGITLEYFLWTYQKHSATLFKATEVKGTKRSMSVINSVCERIFIVVCHRFSTWPTDDDDDDDELFLWYG